MELRPVLERVCFDGSWLNACVRSDGDHSNWDSFNDAKGETDTWRVTCCVTWCSHHWEKVSIDELLAF